MQWAYGINATTAAGDDTYQLPVTNQEDGMAGDLGYRWLGSHQGIRSIRVRHDRFAQRNPWV